MRWKKPAIVACGICKVDRPSTGRCAYIRGIPGGAPQDHCLRCCKAHEPAWAWKTWRVFYPMKWRGKKWDAPGVMVDGRLAGRGARWNRYPLKRDRA